MATKRQRGSKWEFIVKRAGVLDKPIYLTFGDEAEGDEYCRKLEGLLDRGIVPTEYRPTTAIHTIEHLVDSYCRDHAVKPKDVEILGTVVRSVGQARLVSIDAAWVDAWVSDMKRIDKLAPATIRSKVGALARCTDWGVRKKLLLLPDHPLRTLPEGYATYTDEDTAIAGTRRADIERDRRLAPEEEAKVRATLQGGVLARKQRPLTLEHGRDMENLMDVALESAMRLREIYTLTKDQVRLDQRTVFLDKTKNGDKRQVPLSSKAGRVLKEQMDRANPIRCSRGGHRARI